MEMAKRVGVNRSSWSRIENGEAVPNAVLLDRIGKALGKDSSEILAEANAARDRLQREGVEVHLEKPAANTGSKKVGWGLALLGAAALGGLVAGALKDKEGEPSEDSPKRLPHRPDDSSGG